MPSPEPVSPRITAVEKPTDGLDAPFFRGKKLVQHDFKERTTKPGGPGVNHSHRRAWRQADEKHPGDPSN